MSVHCDFTQIYLPEETIFKNLITLPSNRGVGETGFDSFPYGSDVQLSFLDTLLLVNKLRHFLFCELT
jgi:hypothetical protein